MGGRAGRKGGAGNREEEEAMQGRGAEATGQGGWAENKLQSGGGVPQEDRESSQPPSLELSSPCTGRNQREGVDLLSCRIFWYV